MQVVCFDFDGVICDSAPETAFTAWHCCRSLWPQGPAFTPALQAHFGRLRPALHTGWEAIPLLRLAELGTASDAAVLADFPALRDALLTEAGLTVDGLKDLFGRTRDGLVAQDRAGWLKWNRFYPGLATLLADLLAAPEAGQALHIITTKQARFVTLLLAHHGLSLPADHIHGLERGLSKPALLLERRTQFGADATLHFIEDRVETLHDVIATPGLADVRLYLVDWGYNTADQRKAAAATGRIRVVDPAALRAALLG